MIIPEHGNALRIVDRVKNIFKLQQGEYISPEKIENILSGCKYVDQIFIYGDSLQNYLIAFIYPNQNEIIKILKNKYNDINEENYKEHLDEDDLKKEIIKDIDIYGRKNDLKGFELPKKYIYVKNLLVLKNKLLLRP